VTRHITPGEALEVVVLLGPLETAVTLTLPNISLTTLLYAIVVSAVYGLTGYLNSLKLKGEQFSPLMFTKTIIISLIVAVVMAYSGLDPQTNIASAWVFVAGNPALMVLVDKIVNDFFSLKGITIIVQQKAPGA
jgi:hypothetical protein